MARKRDEWMCPRCCLEGDHLKSPDPTRCKQCCRQDAAYELYVACKALHHEYDQTYDGTPSAAWPAGMLLAAELASAALRLADGHREPNPTKG